MSLPRRALAVAGALIVVLGVEIIAGAAAVQAASGTGTRASVKASHLVTAGQTRLHASRGGPVAANLGIEGPYGITVGPDGALWFTNSGSIGRITTGGTVTIYTDPSIYNRTGSRPARTGHCGSPAAATTKSGGSTRPREPLRPTPTQAWSTHSGSRRARTGRCGSPTTGAPQLHRADRPTTGRVTTYTDPSIAQPVGITAGPDGAVWFTNSRRTTLHRADHHQRDSHQLPGPAATTVRDHGRAGRGAVVHHHAAEPIGRITTSGTVTNYTGAGISATQGITSGPDGALWFTNQSGSIGRIDPPRERSRATPTPGLGLDPEPEMITAGPDGALWFTNTADNTIGRITTSGTVTIYSYTALGHHACRGPGSV